MTAVDPAADAVLHATVAAARAEFGSRLEAVYAIGSLAHGGFAPLVSDVDVALVVRRASASTAGRVAVVAADVWERVPGPLTRRLSLFWTDIEGLGSGAGHGRLGAVDRLDLLEHGRLLAGADVRDGAARPAPDALAAESTAFLLDRLDATSVARLRRPDALLALGVRDVTKTVLMPVRLCFTAATGGMGSVPAAVAWFRAVGDPADAVALVEAAARWRDEGLPEATVARPLLNALPLLYARCADTLPRGDVLWRALVGG